MVGCSLAADPTLLPHLDDYTRSACAAATRTRSRAPWPSASSASAGERREADADMLSLLEDLVGEWAGEKEAHEALGLSDRAQGLPQPDAGAGAG